MAVELFRKIADRFFPPLEVRHPDAVVMKPSFFDPKLEDLLDSAFELLQKGEEEESRLRYLQAAAMQTAIFDNISPNNEQGIRDRAEYGVMALSGLVSAHENDQAREFGAKLFGDPLIPDDAKQRTEKLIEFLNQSPEW